MGCYFDDLVHRLLDLNPSDDSWQSVCHFTVAVAVDALAACFAELLVPIHSKPASRQMHISTKAMTNATAPCVRSMTGPSSCMDPGNGLQELLGFDHPVHVSHR